MRPETRRPRRESDASRSDAHLQARAAALRAFGDDDRIFLVRPGTFRSGRRESPGRVARRGGAGRDRKSTRLNSSHGYISYAVFCLKKKNSQSDDHETTTDTAPSASMTVASDAPPALTG